MPNTSKELHGNRARIDPAKKVVGRNIMNTATISSRKAHETPLVSDESVAYAKKFVEENKK